MTFSPSTAGAFRLIAYVDLNGNGTFDEGEQLRTLRIAIVRVTLQPGSTLATANTLFPFTPELGMSGVASAMMDGTGAITAVPMSLTADYLLEGGGAMRTIGAGAIHVGNVGNLLSDTFMVNYSVSSANPTAGTESENPGGTPPIVDTSLPPPPRPPGSPIGGVSAFRSHSGTVPAPAPATGGFVLHLTSIDGPEFDWDSTHPTTGNNWATTNGNNAFREFSVAFSNSFTRTYLALNQASWTVTAYGYSAGGSWVDSGSSVTGDSTMQPVGATPVQVLGPSFIYSNVMTHSP